jgi:hypothetical protein
MESIEVLKEAYDLANDTLRSSSLYIAKEAAGMALQEAYEAVKQERLAARVAAHAARLRNTCSIPDATGDSVLVLSHESGEL